MSAKASAQPGRRTPLSLTGATSKQQQQQQQQSQKTTSTGLNEIQNNSKNDNKTVSINQKTEKSPTDNKESLQKDKKLENVEKKSQPASKIPTVTLAGQSKKPEKNEKKTQNGVGSSSSSNGNAKEKQTNGKDAKVNLKEIKDKTEVLDNDKKDKVDNDKSGKLEKDKSSKYDDIEKLNENPAKKLEKDKSSKCDDDIEKLNENPAKNDLKTEEVEKQKDFAKLTGIEKDKGKEIDKKEKKQPEKELRAKRGNLENNEKKNQEKQHDVIEQIDVNLVENKPVSPITKTELATSIKHTEKSPSNKSPPSSKATKSTAAVTIPIKSTTTVIDDVEMEPLTVEQVTPTKILRSSKKESFVVTSQTTASQPTATSTPGKLQKRKEIFTGVYPASEVKSAPSVKCSLPDRNSCPRTFSQISGRRSIRGGSDFTTSYLQNNAQYRESYRKINTELDISSTTNTSLNVTVGSEVPNNFSFSFFGRGRKRDRTPPNLQSTMDLQNDLELSPKSPKRARIDMYGFLTVVASPLSLLRARFSKASIQSSTPVKLQSKLAEAVEDEVEVQNVSGISIEEEIPSNAAIVEDVTATEAVEVTVENDEDGTQKKNSSSALDGNAITVDEENIEEMEAAIFEKCGMEKPIEGIDEDTDDIKVTETVNVNDALGKNKRCNLM